MDQFRGVPVGEAETAVGTGVFLVQAMSCDDLTFRGGGHKVIEHRMTNRRGVNVLGIGD